jgi:hypothetical protein
MWPLFAEIIAAAAGCEQSNRTLMPQCAALGIGRSSTLRDLNANHAGLAA